MATSNYWSSQNFTNGRGVPTSSSSIAASTLPAVSRSAEWWSCIRTAVKIAQSTAAAASATLDSQHQQQQQPWWVGWNPPVQLPAAASLEQSEVWQLQEDGLSLLRGMQAELQKLQSLVRRRGHTNDPTQDIAHSVRQLELDAQELATLIQQQQQQQQRRYSAQYQRHVALVAQWLQQAASQQASQLKEILQVRANVLQEQAQQRRKLLKTTTTNGAHDNTTAASKIASPRSGNSLSNTNNAATAAAFQSPLFTATPQSLKTSQKRRTRLTASSSSVSANSQPASQLHSNGNSEGSSVPAVHSAPSSNGFYGSNATSTPGYSYYGNASSTSSFGGGGYGGGSSSMGIRRRAAAGAAASNRSEDSTVTSQEDWVVQEQIQERQKQRHTQYRVEAARQAERTLSELSTLFGKMSMLITQQGETLQKVEDDVESAVADVSAGQAELQILHSIKKGNRSLIIKVFGLLIFFIIFMKFYANKRR